MWPLLKKDGLGLQYLALLVLWNKLIGYNPLRLPAGTFVQLISLVIITLGRFCIKELKHGIYRVYMLWQQASMSSN